MYRRIFREAMFRRHLLKLAIAAILSLMTCACSRTLHQGRMYGGPPLPIKNICILIPESAQVGGISIKRIDGQYVEIGPSETVELLPGKHPLDVVINAEFFLSGYREHLKSSDPIPLDFVCDGGNVYLAGYALRYNDERSVWDWQPVIENITDQPNIRKYIQQREERLKK